MIGGVNRDPCFHEVAHDVSLKIGEREGEIRLKGQDFRDISADEGRDARLFTPDTGRMHSIARHPDDPLVLAEQVEGLDGLFRETHDALRRVPQDAPPCFSWRASG
jgi:hypothetical protein